jgi:cyclohexa-1,5-dienecarbonyl-CoA hydratase
MSAPLTIQYERGGALLRLTLARPKANIIDADMIAALSAAFADATGHSALRGILLNHEGPHFSFGASVAEHMPGECAAMLGALHGLIGQMLDCPVPVLVAVRGQCLGGGLEVAMAGSLIFAAPDAALGQPEIKIGVFAPAASAMLPLRLPQMDAEDMLLSGRSIDGTRAGAIGLAAVIDADPEAAALAYFETHLEPLSASSLQLAVVAARGEFAARARARLAEVERLYLETLMQT